MVETMCQRGRRWVWLAIGAALGFVPVSASFAQGDGPEAPAQAAQNNSAQNNSELSPPVAAAEELADPPRAGSPGPARLPEEGAVVQLQPPSIPSPPTLLDPSHQPIDLNTALRLAGVQNPQLLLARQRVVESVALRQLAAAQILPSINLGMNYDSHTGPLQQSNGNILSVQRSALYVGAGANAIAAGTVNIPGVVLQGNIAEGVYAFLTARQVVQAREFGNVAVRNQVFLQVTQAYSELIRAEGRRALSVQNRDESREVARLTASYAASGQGRAADANRAATELARREAELQAAEGEVLTSSARLAALLNLDPSIRLHPTDAAIVPMPIVPDPVPVSELIAIGLLRRPELGERRALIREAMLALEGSKVLPFSPTLLVGFSAGGFGGGSNIVKPVFGGFGARSDFDVVAYWTIRNLGVGNLALINLANARLQGTRFQELAVLNMVRAEVAEAYARTHARFAQIGTTEQAVLASKSAFERDYQRIKLRAERDVLPIELLDSFRLLARSRNEYLDAIVDYNRAQFELYVALGQPPADALARPAPINGIEPTNVVPTDGTPVPMPSPAPTGPFAVPPDANVPLPPTPRAAANTATGRRTVRR